MNEEIIKLAREYTQETANLRDYQCQVRSAIYGRQMAQRILKQCEKDGTGPFYDCEYVDAKEIAEEHNVEVEHCDPSDETFYIWALVPEYNSHGQAKVVLRRIGTADGEVLLPQEKRAKKRLKMTDREQSIVKARMLKAIVDKIKNYEGQIKTERGRLAEQIRNNDKVYMEAEAVEIKRICDKMKEELDDFLDLIM